MRVQHDDRFTRNQCSFLVRIDGEELEIPLNFGLTADEIRQLYPYILSVAATKVENPAIVFANETKYGKYSEISDDEYSDLLIKLKAQSKFWYDKPEASLLDIAIRFALDIKMKGIAELANIFETISPLESIKSEPISDEEADLIISRLNLETPTDHEFDAGEKALESGQAGSNVVNIYDSTDDDEYFSDELDAMTMKLSGDKFEKIISDTVDAHDESEYIKPISTAVPDQIRDMMSDTNDTNVFGEAHDEYDNSDPDEEVPVDDDEPSEVSFADDDYDEFGEEYNDVPFDSDDEE